MCVCVRERDEIRERQERYLNLVYHSYIGHFTTVPVSARYHHVLADHSTILLALSPAVNQRYVYKYDTAHGEKKSQAFFP